MNNHHPIFDLTETYISIKSRTMFSHMLAVSSHHKTHWLLSARSGGRLWLCGFWVKTTPGCAEEKRPPGWWQLFGPAAYLQIKCSWLENSGSPRQPWVYGLGLKNWEENETVPCASCWQPSEHVIYYTWHSLLKLPWQISELPQSTLSPLKEEFSFHYWESLKQTLVRQSSSCFWVKVLGEVID